jgi:hypothetical protein
MLPPRSTAWVEALLRGQFELSLLRHNGRTGLRLSLPHGQNTPLAVQVESRMLENVSATPLQHAMAGTHPVDCLRRLLPLSGGVDWRWVWQSCGVQPQTLEGFQETIQRLPVSVEGLLWEVSRDERELEELWEWLDRLWRWGRPGEGMGVVAARIAEDPDFVRSAPYALLDFCGCLQGTPTPPDIAAAVKSLVSGPGYDALLLRLHSLARRGHSRLCPGKDPAPLRSLAEQIAHAAPAALAPPLLSELSKAGTAGGWLLDAWTTEPALAHLALDQMREGRPLRLPAESGWTITGPLAPTLQRRRYVPVRLPWMSLRESVHVYRGCAHTALRTDEAGQLHVTTLGQEHHTRWVQLGSDILSGVFSSRDGLAQGGLDKLVWSASYDLSPGPLPRFFGRLLNDYGFPELPALDSPARVTLEFSVRRDLAESWAQTPHSRDPEYAVIVTRIARTLQWAMRRWVPFLYFLENPDLYSSRTAMPILIFVASTPRALRKRREFGYEVVNKQQVAQAIRTAANRLADVYREFDPDRRTLENRYRSVLKSTSVTSALNYVWRYPRMFEQLLHFDLFLIEQSVNLLESARRLRNSLHLPAHQIARLFHNEVQGMAKSIRHRLHRRLPADLDDYVPLLFIQAIAALHGEGRHVEIPSARMTIEQDGWKRVIANRPAALDEEQSFDGLSIPALADDKPESKENLPLKRI